MHATVPTGLHHIHGLEWLHGDTVSKSKAAWPTHAQELKLIGTCLGALYQAATCHRKCHGGPHVLEALCGRTYNLAAAALQLSFAGYYDEALNLMRSMGEISNLVSLSVLDKDAIKKWLTLDTKSRISNFSPAAIRKMLKAQPDGTSLMYADGDWYSRFCEGYTHVTPQTKPNAHTTGGTVGGLYQVAGIDTCIGELTNVLVFIAMIICRYFAFDDILEEIGFLLEPHPKE